MVTELLRIPWNLSNSLTFDFGCNMLFISVTGSSTWVSMSLSSVMLAQMGLFFCCKGHGVAVSVSVGSGWCDSCHFFAENKGSSWQGKGIIDDSKAK